MAGPALNFAFRLLAAPAANRVLHESTGIVAVVASENFYEGVISQRPAATPESYEPVRAEFDGFSSGAWLRLMGAVPEPHDWSGGLTHRHGGSGVLRHRVVRDPLGMPRLHGVLFGRFSSDSLVALNWGCWGRVDDRYVLATGGHDSIVRF